MTSGGWLRGLSPFLLGVAMGIVALVAAGLLLYGGPGFLPALVVVLATQLASAALGVGYGARPRGSDPVEVLRRQWLLVLVAVTLAVVFSMAWEWFAGFGAPALSQGLGLALLAALPLFGAGSVVGALSRFPQSGGAAVRDGPAAILGAAAGVLLTGLVFFPMLGSSAALLLLALMVASTGALLQGRSLEGVVWTQPLPGRDGAGAPDPEYLQAWVGGRSERSRFVLAEGGRIRGVLTPEGGPFLSVDRALVRGIEGWTGAKGGRALFLGVGRLPLALHLRSRGRREEGGARVAGLHVMDGSPDLLAAVEELAHRVGTEASVRSGKAAPDGEQEGLILRPVPVEEALAGSSEHLPPASFDLVVLDTLALASSPGAFRLPSGALQRLLSTLRPHGVLILGPLQDGGASGPFLDRAREMARHVPRASLYVAGRVSREEAEERPARWDEPWRQSVPEPGSRPAFMVLGGGRATGWPDRVEGYLRVVLDVGKAAVETEA